MKPSFLNAGDSDHDLASALEAGPSALAPVRRQQAVVPGGSEQEDALHVSLGEGLRPGLPSVPAVFAMISNMLREAFGAMTANKMRTFLTMLGMVIGVAAVILMLAIGQGAQVIVQKTIATMGSNLFVVNSGSSTTAGVRSGAGNAPTLNLDDARAVAELPSVASVAPIHPGSMQMVYGGNNWNASVNGVFPGYFAIRDWRLKSGFLFTDADVRSMSRVAVLGETVARQLFGDTNPVGQTIRIKNSPYLVVGLLERKGQSMEGRDQD